MNSDHSLNAKEGAHHEPTTDLNTFLRYSLELEEESADRLREAAEMMEMHFVPDLERLFLELAEHSVKHCQQIRQICKDRDLPKIAPWDFDWPNAEAPETWEYAAIRYTMTAREILTNMLKVEQSAADFYQNIAKRSTDKAIQTYAREFANEERSHASSLEGWLRRLPEETPRSPDIDPPPEPC